MIEATDNDNLQNIYLNIKRVFEETPYHKYLSVNEQNYIYNSFKKEAFRISKIPSVGNTNPIESFITLIKNYNYYPLQRYPDLFVKACTAYLSKLSTIDKKKIIYILPGALPSSNYQPGDMQYIKSYQTVIYLFKSNLMSQLIDTLPINNIQFKICADFTKLDFAIEQQENIFTDILFVDDFIGEGNSVRKAINFWNSHQLANFHEYSILTLVIEEDTLKKEEFRNRTYYGDLVKKMIDINEINSKNYENMAYNIHTSSNQDDKKAILVSMERTPNNTVKYFKNKKFFKTNPFNRYPEITKSV